MPEPQPDWPRTLEEFRVWHERQPDVAPPDPLHLDPPGVDLAFDAAYDGVPLD